MRLLIISLLLISACGAIVPQGKSNGPISQSNQGLIYMGLCPQSLGQVFQASIISNQTWTIDSQGDIGQGYCLIPSR